MKKRILSLLLVLVLLIQVLPLSGWAVSDAVAAAAASLRQELAQRNESISISYDGTTDSFISLEVLEEAYAHTGVSTEGDYLRHYNYWTTRGAGGSTLTYKFTYLISLEQEEALTAALEEAVASFGFTDDTDDYTRIKTVYDYICGNVVYTGGYSFYTTAYEALLGGGAADEGICALVYRMMLMAGIDCRVVSDGDTWAYCWNIVELDGVYYNLDACADNGALNYSAFLVSNDSLGYTRGESYDTDAFNAAYPMSASDYDCDRTFSGNYPAVTNNTGGQYESYLNRYATPVSSTLYADSDGYVRVEELSDAVTVEHYDADFRFVSRQTIALELPIYGGVFIGDGCNYIISGQENPDESDETEVVRVTQYTKDWERVGHASLFGGNTYVPFDAGSLRCVEAGDYLYIRTCHEMYDQGDGLHHQASMLLCVDTTDMTLAASQTSVMNVDYNYVSHSFNQFIFTDGDTMLAADHGDAYPRSVVLMKYAMAAGTIGSSTRVSYVEVLPISGDVGDNSTGVKLGGALATDTHYLVAGSSADQSGDGADLVTAQQNIFVTATDKNNFTSAGTTTYWLTDYEDTSIDYIHLVKVSGTESCLLWNAGDAMHYVFLNADGSARSEIYTADAALSDCVPIVCDGTIVWYATSGSKPVFYTIDLSDEDTVTQPHSHAYTAETTAPTCTEPGAVTYTCTVCGSSYTETTPALGHNYQGGACTRCGDPDPDVLASGTAGEGITWLLYTDYELVLSGTGAMDDYASGTKPWQDYADQITSVTVGEGITILGSYAFYSLDNLVSATLPSTLTSIGTAAFESCGSLAAVDLPAGLTSIGTAAFADCVSLTEVTVPDGVTSIGHSAFAQCEGLVSVHLPAGLTSIEQRLFANCTSLTSVNIPEGVTSIGRLAFASCEALTSLSIPASVTSIGTAFYGCTTLTGFTVAVENPAYCNDAQGALYTKDMTVLMSIPGGFKGSFAVPGSVTELWEYAGAWCPDMTGITLPDSVTTLGSAVFSHSGLKELTIPGSVTSLPDSLCSVCADLAAVTIPNSVTAIGDGAFDFCYSLTDVTMPARLDSLGGAFSFCTSLTTIVVPEGVTALESGTFAGCTALETVTLPSTLRSIGQHGFLDCAALASINLPEGLTTIGVGAFIRCESLKELRLPSTLTYIARLAFYDSGLETVWFTGDAPEFEDTTVFEDVTATVYYPMYNDTWTEEVRQQYRGVLTWVATDQHTHAWLAATCTEPMTCSVCGETSGEALGHDIVTDEGSPATCTKSGLTEGSHCGRCGEVFAAQEVIPATGHSPVTDEAVSATCTEPGLTEGSHCGTCGEVLAAQEVVPATGHNWDEGVVTKDPTEEEMGVRTYTCTACGETREELIPELGHEHSYTSTVTAPTCTEGGYTTHTCRCGDSFVDSYTDPLGHDLDGITCTRCGLRINPFTDVPEGIYFYESVMWAVENGITTGTTPTTFSPYDVCERCQVVTFLWRAAGSPEPSITENPFTDVKESDYFYKAVLWAVEKGITTGTSPTTFSPYDVCERAQVVTFLWRAQGRPVPSLSANPFSDVSGDAYFYQSVLWAVENGITSGTTAATFSPYAVTERCQIVTFLYRTYN